MNLNHYKTLIFDCDGVLLNSNKVKTEAFYKAALPYGEQQATLLKEYHVAHGGISRYKKFEFFLDQIVKVANNREEQLKQLLDNYAQETWKGLLSCEIVGGLERLRKHFSDSRWLVVSGGDQKELRRLFSQRDIKHFFDGGIFGSPDTKDEILEREHNAGNIEHPAVFMGDSSYDHRAAEVAGLDFVFISSWSELPDWEGYVSKHGLPALKSLAEFIPCSMTNLDRR